MNSQRSRTLRPRTAGPVTVRSLAADVVTVVLPRATRIRYRYCPAGSAGARTVPKSAVIRPHSATPRSYRRPAAVSPGAGPDDITPALFVSVRVDSSLQSGRQVLGDYAIANYGMPLEELERIQAIVTGTPQRVVESLNVPADGVHLGDLAVLDARMRLP